MHALIDRRRDVTGARYDRAQSYERLENYVAALADYALIAEDGPTTICGTEPS